MKEKKTSHIIASNKKAFHEYSIEDKIECGISLKGSEVKALRLGKVNLADGWVDIENGIPILKEVHIGQYKFATYEPHVEKRERLLLLKKSEIAKLTRKIDQKGFTLVPLKIYFNKHLIKVEIGVARGKKLYDKRDTQKKKDAQRQIDRAVKNLPK